MYFPYLDCLRIVLHILRCIMHLSVPFMLLPSAVWPIRAAMGYSEIADGFVFVVHVCVMEIFFAMNGFFAMMILEKKGYKYFILNRLHRIGIPFLLGTFVLVPIIMSLGFSWQQGKSINEVLPQVLPAFQHLQFTFAHLWSLWYLLIIYVIFLMLFKIKTLKIKELLKGLPLFSILLFVLGVATFCLVCFPRKYTLLPIHTLAEWQMILYFFTFFIFGVWYYFHEKIIITRKPTPLVWLILIISFAINIFFQKTDNQLFVVKTIGSLAYVIQAISCLILSWQGVKNWTWQPTKLTEYSQAMYWIYWIEVPIALFAHYCFVNTIPALALILGTTFLTLVFGYFTYLYFLRKTTLGKYLGFVS